MSKLHKSTLNTQASAAATSLSLIFFLAGCGGGGSAGGGGSSAPVVSSAPNLVTLSGDVTPGVLAAPVIGPVDPQMTIQLALTLPLRIGPPDLPGAPPLTPEQFDALYGPTQSDYDHLQAFATASGLQVTGTYPGRTLLDIVGTASAVEAAFHVHLFRIKRPDGTEAYGPDAEPSVPADVAALYPGILGLDDFGEGMTAGAVAAQVSHPGPKT